MDSFDGADPLLRNLKSVPDVGLLAIEFETRRRMRLNGIAEVKRDGIYVKTDQVYSNCPRYIQSRKLLSNDLSAEQTFHVQRGTVLTPAQKQWIAQADTFFIASFHPEGGADVSHRGGNSGFLRVLNDGLLAWPDYSGNNMFQTLGNINSNPRAGLLFVDFEGGTTVQITGEARINWDPARAAEFAGAERLIEFEVNEIIETSSATPLRWRFLDYSRSNPD